MPAPRQRLIIECGRGETPVRVKVDGPVGWAIVKWEDVAESAVIVPNCAACRNGCPWNASRLRRVFEFVRVLVDIVLQFGGCCVHELKHHSDS